MAKIAINGFGRIGRLLFRAAFDKSSAGQAGLDIVAINDLGDIENLAYLLKYDTVYGKYSREVKTEDGNLVVDGKRIKVLQVKDPLQLPWKDFGVDIAVEATGLFESYEKSKVHLAAGAKKAVITAPAKDADTADAKTILMGVNEEAAKTCSITSNGSCTTNAAAPVVAIMAENPGIEKAILSTVHGYTATQNLVDGPARGGKDFRKGRAAAQNISPSTTGAAISVVRAIPELTGKFDGLSYRVPTITGSLADITFVSKRLTSAEEINDIFTRAALEPRWQGILKVTAEQLVSSDVLGEPYGAIVDLSFTRVIGGNLVKVLSWYDNEAGYVSTLLKHIEAVAKLLN